MRTPEREASLLDLVSPYTGIVRSLVEFTAAADEARTVVVGAALAAGEPVLGVAVSSHSSGFSRDGGLATAAAVGEAVERYAAAFLPLERLVLASAEELGPAALPPERFALFHDAQYETPGFPFTRFDRTTRLHWVEGRSLRDGAGVWLPAPLVFLEPLPADPLVAVPTSNGLACGRDAPAATLAALLELVERDAFMIAWANRLSLPLLDWRGDPELVALDRRYFRPTGLRYAAVDLGALSGVPAVLGVVHGPPGELGALGVGAGCAATIGEAWWKALAEAFAVRRWARDAGLERDGAFPARPDDVETFDDHIAWYATAERAEAASFLDASTERRPVAEVAPLPGETDATRLDSVVSALGARGLDAFAVDVTTADVRAAGLAVVRAVVPELCQLDVAYRARYLGGRRLFDAPVAAGLRDRPATLAELNHDPHPFP